MTSVTGYYRGVYMHVWQLQEAKAKLTQLVNEAKAEVQFISRHGVAEVAVISMEKYEEVFGPKRSIMDFFQASPLYGLELDLERDQSKMREIDL